MDMDVPGRRPAPVARGQVAEGDVGRPRDPLGEGEAFQRVAATVRRLRAPGGCPWDRAQTHASLRPYALEEAREVALAIADGDALALRDELGDLLLQVLLHAAIAEESGAFSLGELLEGLRAKLVRRHPHVFGEATPAASPEEAARRWAAAKAGEADAALTAASGEGLLAAVARTRPALTEARELGERAAEVGFDWPGPEEVAAKLHEEQDEFAEAWRAWWALRPTASGAAAGASTPGGVEETPGERAARLHAEEEFGDLLFAAVQVGRLLGIDAEVALLAGNEKFRRRFAAVEGLLAAEGSGIHGHGLVELDRLWERVKAGEAPPQGPPG